MTTAHRPTFDPARGKDAQRGPAYHQRLLPAYTQLKTRQPGQGGNTDSSHHDLRSQLLAAEAAHRQPKSFTASSAVLPADHDAGKRSCEEAAASDELEDEAGRIAKRQRILDATRKLDADSESSASEVSDE
ncbi:hypothetical protein MMC25_008361, partial [Agyrium rufum]|nr:hypothetical protein [Agyrium rufum]